MKNGKAIVFGVVGVLLGSVIVFGILQNSHTSEIKRIYAGFENLEEITDFLDAQEQELEQDGSANTDTVERRLGIDEIRKQVYVLSMNQ